MTGSAHVMPAMSCEMHLRAVGAWQHGGGGMRRREAWRVDRRGPQGSQEVTACADHVVFLRPWPCKQHQLKAWLSCSCCWLLLSVVCNSQCPSDV